MANQPGRSKPKQKNCNQKLLKETAAALREHPTTVENLVGFYSKFIAQKIKEGGFEGVQAPYFGKFTAKLKEIQWRNYMQGLPEAFRQKKPRGFKFEDDDPTL